MINIQKKLLNACVLLNIFFVLFIGCKKEKASNQWRSIDAELTTLYTIGDTDSSFYFAHPDYAATTSDNKVVIADRGLNKLMAFDGEGNYLHDIGSKGPGPDEFRDIKGMWIDKEDEITVFDRSAQTFKQFIFSGEYQESHVNRGSNIVSGIKAVYLENLPLLFYKSQSGNGKNNLFHLYTTDYDSILSSNFTAQKLDGFDEMMIIQLGLAAQSGSFLFTGSTVHFAPRLYNGYIYKFRLSEDQNSINLIEKITGLTYKESLTEIDKSADYYDLRLSGVQGEHKFYLHNETLGLYQLNDGRIVHFTYIENEEGTARTFGAEIYTAEMEPIGYTEFYTKKFEDVVQSRLLGKKIRAKDNSDRFYLHDITGDYDKYEVLKLEIDSVAAEQ